MELPPKPTKKKKKKKKVVKEASQKDEEEEEEETDSELDDEEEGDDAIEKRITKAFPDYKQCVQLIEELREQFPQTDINGEKNIWIVKPA